MTIWGTGNDDEPTHVALAQYAYPKQVTSRADSSRIKIGTYSYGFWDTGDMAVKQITTTLPSISTSQNGSGVATATYAFYDEEGRLRWTKDGEGYVSYYSYNPNLGGVALAVKDVNTASLNSNITGTGSGNWVAWSGAAGLTRGSGLPTALELTSKYEYDDIGRANKFVYPGGDKLTAYNASSSTSDQVTEYKFENAYSAALVTKEIYPDGDATSDNVQMTYHLDGSLNTKTDQRGVVFTYSYDNARRTTLQAATTIPTGVDNNVQSIGRAYDTLGRTETVSSYAGTTTGSTVLNQIKYVYGTHGQITKSTQDHSGAVGGTEPNVQYAYDDSAASNIYEDGLRLETMTYPNSRVVFYGYDNAARIRGHSTLLGRHKRHRLLIRARCHASAHDRLPAVLRATSTKESGRKRMGWRK